MFEFIDHTADIRMKVTAPTREELFLESARGMFAYMYGDNLQSLPAGKARQIAIRSEDEDSLLVDWLSHLLFLSLTEYHAFLPLRFRNFDLLALDAEIVQVTAAPIHDIKAVTYHGLAISMEGDRYSVTITFDI